MEQDLTVPGPSFQSNAPFPAPRLSGKSICEENLIKDLMESSVDNPPTRAQYPHVGSPARRYGAKEVDYNAPRKN